MSNVENAPQTTDKTAFLRRQGPAIRGVRARVENDGLPILCLFVLTVLFFSRVLFTNTNVIPYDAEFWHFPQEAYLVEQLARGHLPLWTPYVYGGMPFAANMQAGVFYPINLAMMLAVAHVRGYLPYRALEGIEVLHYFVASIGTYALTRHLGASRTSAMAGAFVYSGGPYLASQAQHIGLIESAAWVPWVALFVRRAMTRGNIVDAALASIFWSFCFLSGFFAAAIPVAIALAIYCCQAIIRAFFQSGNCRYPNALATSSVFALLGAGLIAVQVLPTMELTANSIAAERAAGGSATPLAYLITVILPNFFNRNSDLYWSHADATQNQFYFGFLPLLVLPFTFQGRAHSRSILLAAVATLGLVIGLGPRTPLASILIESLPPTIGKGLYVYTFRVYLDLSVAILTAMGLEAVMSSERVPSIDAAWSLVRMLTVALASILSVIFVTVYILLLLRNTATAALAGNSLVANLDAVVSGLLVASLSLAWTYGALSLAKNGVASRSVSFALVGALVIPLLLGNSNNRTNTRAGNPIALRTTVPVSVAYLQLQQHNAPYIRYDRSDGLSQLWGTMSQLWSVPFANGNDPFMPANYRTYRDAFVLAPQTSRTTHRSDYRSALADLLSIDYVVTVKDPVATQSLTDTNKWRKVFEGNGEEVFKNLKAMPHAFVARQGQVVAVSDMLSKLQSPNFDPNQVVLLENIPNSQQAKRVTSSPWVRPASYRSTSPDRVDVLVESGPPGWLVLTDPYFPGWIARINGRAVPIERADFLFRAVYVNGNKQTVTFTYEPRSVRLGLLLTAATWLVVVSVLLRKPLKRVCRSLSR